MKKINLLMLGLVVLLSTSCTQILPTEAGFKINNSGDYRGVDSLPLLTGWQTYFPSQSYIVTIPTTMQHIIWSEAEQEGGQPNQHITINAMGGSGFKVDVGMNYRVKPDKASRIYLKYKMDNLDYITNTFLRTLVRGSMQDVSGKMTVDSMLNNLPFYENVVRADLAKRFEAEGFILDNFNIISKPRPDDPALAAAINRKITAIQDAQTEVQKQAISKAKANQKVQTAYGDSADIVIRTNAQAYNVKTMQQQLTPEYIEYQRILRWNGAYPSTMLGSGSQTLLNLK